MQILPLIETERITLRDIEDSDLSEVFAMRSDPELMRYIPRPLCISHDDAMKHIRMIRQNNSKNESVNWGIARRSDNKLIGIGGYVRRQPDNFRAEIGYILLKEEHQKGIMREIMPVMLKYGFEKMNLNTIEAIIDPDNIASEKLLLHFGFVKEAHFRENIFFEGRYMDSVHYTLFRT